MGTPRCGNTAFNSQDLMENDGLPLQLPFTKNLSAKCQVLRLILTAAPGDCVFLVHGAGNRLREVRGPTQGHTASKRQTGIRGQVFLTQKRVHLPQICTAPGAPQPQH